MEKTKNGPHPPPLPFRSRTLISSGFSWAHSPQDSHESRAFLVVQMTKDLPSTQETSVWSPSWEDPLEKGMATHSSILTCSILTWRITCMQEPDGLQSMGSQRVGSNWPICQFSEYSFSSKEISCPPLPLPRFLWAGLCGCGVNPFQPCRWTQYPRRWKDHTKRGIRTSNGLMENRLFVSLLRDQFKKGNKLFALF